MGIRSQRNVHTKELNGAGKSPRRTFEADNINGFKRQLNVFVLGEGIEG